MQTTLPIEQAACGVRFDFNDGARASFPDGEGWRVAMIDADSGLVHCSGSCGAGEAVASGIKYFVRWTLLFFKGDSPEPVFAHTLDLKGRNVLVICEGALGDTIAWFSACRPFMRRHGCRLTVRMGAACAELFRPDYPDIRIVATGEEDATEYYATYRLGVWVGGDPLRSPRSWHDTRLDMLAYAILGMGEADMEPPSLPSVEPFKAPVPYAAIACQSSAMCKNWNNRHGWTELVEWLNGRGLDAACIDLRREYGAGVVVNRMPDNAEDWTGGRPLRERAAQIKGAAFFVGLASGLSWLAWAVGAPVVLVSGFSDPGAEFPTPYRVWNPNVCHGCWNDPATPFDKDFFWCPRKQGIGEKYECTRGITPRMVISACERLMLDRGMMQDGDDALLR